MFFVGKSMFYVKQYDISGDVLSVTDIAEMREYTETERQWIDSLTGVMEFERVTIESEE